MIDRRQFIGALGLSAGAAYMAGGLPRPVHAGATSRSTIEVLLNEPLGTISPDLYGYLLENLGTVIYDGVWVGEDSTIPNVGGIRKALIEHLREIKASVIRWPGGNFADYYDWKDGVGPKATRPRRTNPWTEVMPARAPSGPQRFDPNAFGTPEFMRLCHLTGGRPYLNANVRGLTAQDFSRWVEYCNSPAGSTTLADQRTADGSAEPYGVHLWGIGNEVWDWGGRMTTEEYAAVYKRFTSHVSGYGADLSFIACGGPPPTTDTQWIREFLRACKRTFVPVPVGAMSLHYYATNLLEDLLQPGQTVEQLAAMHPNWTEADWLKLMPEAVAFDTTGWYEVLAKSTKMDAAITTSWKAMEEFDPAHKIKLAVDEWGDFYRPGTELSALDFRGPAVTLRSALAAALTLDIFHRHADKLLLACFTGLINQEGGLFRAQGDQFVATPIYHVFKLYASHQGGQSVRAIFQAPTIRQEQHGRSLSLWGLNGSASVRDQELTLTIVNPHVNEPVEALISLGGGEAAGGTVVTLSHTDIRAQNTFADPDRVWPTVAPLKAEGPSFSHLFPPASVTCITLRLK